MLRSLTPVIMRLVVFVLLVLAPAVSAQSQYASDAGPYVTLDALDPLRLGDGAIEIGIGAGWRMGQGLDVGVQLGAEHTRFDAPDRRVSEARRLAFGVETGYTARLSELSGLRFSFAGALAQTVEIGAPSAIRDGDDVIGVVDRGNLDVNVGGVLLSAAAFRRVPVGGIVVQPTVGVFFGGDVEARAVSDRPFTLRADSGRGSGGEGRGGISVGLPILFRVGKTNLAIDLRGAYDVVREAPDTSIRLRANL